MLEFDQIQIYELRIPHYIRLIESTSGVRTSQIMLSILESIFSKI